MLEKAGIQQKISVKSNRETLLNDQVVRGHKKHQKGHKQHQKHQQKQGPLSALRIASQMRLNKQPNASLSEITVSNR